MPSDADALPLAPALNSLADTVDPPDDLVTGDARVDEGGHQPFHRQGVAVTDAAGFYRDTDLVTTGFGQLSLLELEGATGFRD